MRPSFELRRTIRSERIAIAFVTMLTACEVVDRNSGKRPATTDTSRGTVSADTARTLTRDSARADSAAAHPAPPDSVAMGDVKLSPESSRAGDVVFALAEGVSVTRPHCTWRDQPLPCHRLGDDVIATVPISAGDSAGTYPLSFERPGGRIERSIAVGERDFGREIILLDKRLYSLVTRRREIARDARAILATVSSETAERLWHGAWREPLAGSRSASYGVERFYYPAADSTRAITLDPTAATVGAFAADTSTSALKGAPGWRHAGVDIAVPLGTVINAPAGGRIADVGRYVLTGRTILIDHGQGVYSAYFHLDSIAVRRGEAVEPGQLLGRVGSTGLATAPHLHYGIYVHGRDVDPASWAAMPEWVRYDPSATVGDSTDRRR